MVKSICEVCISIVFEWQNYVDELSYCALFHEWNQSYWLICAKVWYISSIHHSFVITGGTYRWYQRSSNNNVILMPTLGFQCSHWYKISSANICHDANFIITGRTGWWHPLVPPVMPKLAFLEELFGFLNSDRDSVSTLFHDLYSLSSRQNWEKEPNLLVIVSFIEAQGNRH